MQHGHESSSSSYAGVDVAKDKLDLFVDAPGRQPTRSTLANDDAGVTTLLDTLRGRDVRLVLVEATGRYHRRLVATLLEEGIPVRTINPAQARAFAKAIGRLEKNDRVDAQMLATFARSVDPRPDAIPRENQTLLRDLVSRRRALVQMRIAERNRAHDDLPTLAKRQSHELLRLLEQQVEDLDRQIAKLVESDDDWHNASRIIDSVPGVGPDSANQIVAELPELGKLNRQEIAKLAGLAPIDRDSGRFRGQRHIAGGRAGVRVTLYMIAHNAVLWCTRFKTFYSGLVARGKSHKQAMTACMRKLLVTLNQMVKTNTLWNEQPQKA